MNKEFFINKRKELLNLLENNSAVILFAGEPVTSSADQFFNFEVSRNFYYMTGVDVPYSIVLMIKVESTTHEYLFVQKKDETKEKWTGILPSVDEYSKISGVALDKVSYIDEFAQKAYEELSKFSVKKLYMDNTQAYASFDSFKTFSEKAYPEVADVSQIIFEMRAVKSPEEIEEIRESIAITQDAISYFANNMTPGILEYELKACFEYAVAKKDAGLAFATICAADKNAVILHYPYGRDAINEDSMVLLDCGAAKRYYCADVTRTLPVGGEFTQRQKQVYDIVLKANKLVAEIAKPGETLMSLNDAVKELFDVELKKLGLVADTDEVVKYYYHSVSHSLGLDVHDPLSKTTPLEEGMVITDEPGLYINEWNIGIRIEDDLLITKDGCEVLTKEIPKEVADIANLF